MYASLPLGYNHEIFNSLKFRNEYLNFSSVKINNCEFVSDETIEFDRMFTEYAGQGIYKNIHYTCTGALAIEAAIKTCIIHKNGIPKTPMILTFHNSFHGINSYGGFITSRFPGANERLKEFPEIFSKKINANLEEVEEHFKNNDYTCLLVEPIQCSAGDIYHDKIFFKSLRKLCDEYNVPLVFDEIQIGFGTTGNLWYFQGLEIIPDIVVFGKKTQVSGIMVKNELSRIFNRELSGKLEVTWDGDVSDMIRCKYIIRAYERDEILKNVQKRSDELVSGLSTIEEITNLRNCGLIVGFDLPNSCERDIFVRRAYKNGLMCNSTSNKAVRLRPSLTLTSDHITQCVEILKKRK